MSIDKINELEKENAVLKSEIENLRSVSHHTEKIQKDLWAHEIYLNARKKMLNGVVLLIAVLSGLGLFTLYEMYKHVSTYLEDQAKDRLSKKLEEKINDFLPGMVNEVKGDIRIEISTTAFSAQAETHKTEENLDSPYKPDIPSASTGSKPDNPDTPNTRKKMYFVVGGSSPVKDDLISEKERVNLQAQRSEKALLEDKFPDTKIYPPYENNRNYALIIGGPLPFDKARELRDRAVEYGFRNDSFLWPAEQRYFDLNQ